MKSETNLENISTKTCDNFCQVGDSFCQKPAPESWEKSTFLDPTMIEFEREMRNSMMGKIMENFEKQMMEQTKLIDDLKHKHLEEQKQLIKDRYSKHVPPQLKNEGTKSSIIWEMVHDFLTNPDFDGDNCNSTKKANIKCINPEVYQIILSHGIAAWISTLNSDHLEKLVKRIYSDTSEWISKIWRFKNSFSLFHNKQYDGFLKVCKVALIDRYPRFLTDGYNSLYSRPPVIYLNSAVDSNFVDYLRLNLGLPLESINLVPNNFELGGEESMDTIALEQLILADVSSGKMPLIIYAFAGSPNTGSMDKLNDIHNLCREHKIWLHMEGLRLAQLALLQVPAKVNSISSKVKSLTLDIGSWLGIPAVPYATLIMTDINENYPDKLKFDVEYGIQNKTVMNIFPIWMSLQLMGHDGIIDKIESSTKISHQIFKLLNDIPSLKVISRIKSTGPKNVKNEGPNQSVVETTGIKNLMDTILTYLLEGHQNPSVIVFQYNPSINQAPGNDQVIKLEASLNHTKEVTAIKKPRFVDSDNCGNRLYLNSLNQWLSDNLSAMFPQINMKIINLPSEGLCLRICCQENVIGQDLKSDDVNKFVESIKYHTTIMDSTVTRRSAFQEIVARKEELIFIDLPGWAGLGSVLFLPESSRSNIISLFSLKSMDMANNDFLHFLAQSPYLNEINTINRSLIEELRNDDEAFSLGRHIFNVGDESDENGTEMVTLFCVRFGLITDTTMIDQLIEHVLQKAQKVEDSSKYLEKLSRLVKDGILKVTQELAREQEEKMKQEGIFRQVPYIDSLMNWWSPPTKTQIIGRSLNLSSGEINVTEDIYKYKMQLQTGPNSVFSMGLTEKLTQESIGVSEEL